MGLKVERRRRNWCYYLKIDQAHALVSAIGLVLVLLVLVRLISKAVSSVRRNYIGAWKTSILLAQKWVVFWRAADLFVASTLGVNEVTSFSMLSRDTSLTSVTKSV